MTRHYRILVSGSRNWPDTPEAVATVRTSIKVAGENIIEPGPHALDDWSMVTLVHGGARGLDRMAATVAQEFGMQVEAHRPDYATDGDRAPLDRNQRMVDLGADVLLGFPLGSGWSGTRHCMNVGRKAGLHVVEIICRAIPGSGQGDA